MIGKFKKGNYFSPYVQKFKLKLQRDIETCMKTLNYKSLLAWFGSEYHSIKNNKM